MHSRSSVVLATASWLGYVGIAFGAEVMPRGVSVQVTMLGPAFVDERGMTLYYRPSKLFGGGEAQECSDLPETVQGKVPVADAAARQSCAQKYPPFLAPSNAQPVGYWTIHVRAGGHRQWAYKSRQLHFSTKDKRPGDVGGQRLQRRFWQIASAPVEAPAGIGTRLTSRGVALTTFEGKPLYYADPGAKTSPSADWTPVLVPAMAKSEGLSDGWGVVIAKGGLRQWAWRGNALFSYRYDRGGSNDFNEVFALRLVDVFGDLYGQSIPGWHVALLRAPAPAPASLTAIDVGAVGISIPWPRAYGDATGRPLYAVGCTDTLDCDDVGDSPKYWSSFCAGEERCAKLWQPLRAPKDAQPIDGLWSVAAMNPHHPYKPLTSDEPAIFVWTYQGQFVFTFADDKKPGDTWGLTGIHAGHVYATLIPAFTTDAGISGNRPKLP